MRYAPTPVRLNFGLCWFARWFRFRSREGVCDTPLHLFDFFTGNMMVKHYDFTRYRPT